MKNITGAQAVVETLKSWGVRYVFGLPGTANLDIYDAFYGDPDIQIITTRHEQGAGHMAYGYAKASGKLGVALVSRGPGAANALIAILNAFYESIPVLLLVGEPGTDILGRDAFEEVDLVTMFRPATKWAAELPHPSRIVEFLNVAYRQAMSGRPRPVMLAIPENYQTQMVSIETGRMEVKLPSLPRPNGAALERAMAEIASSRFPTIMAGGGVLLSGASDLLLEFAETLQLPVVAAAFRGDVFPNQHPLYLGASGIAPLATTTAAQSETDLVVALGCRFTELNTNRFTLPIRRLVHVDIDASEIGKIYPAEVGIVADVGAFLSDAIALARSQPGTFGKVPEERIAIRERIQAKCSERADEVVKSQAGVHPTEVIAALNAVARGNETYVLDSATFGNWLRRGLRFARPGSFMPATGGAMGHGFPTAVGAKLARPTDDVICLAGDGAFLMVVQELETAVRHQIPVITIVLNNGGYANVKIKQLSRYQGRLIGSQLGNPDYAALARAFGMHGERVEKGDDIAPALRRCLGQAGPSLIEVVLDQTDLSPRGTTFFTPTGTIDAS